MMSYNHEHVAAGSRKRPLPGPGASVPETAICERQRRG